MCSSDLLARLLFPDPEGPETINNFPLSAINYRKFICLNYFKKVVKAEFLILAESAHFFVGAYF